MSRVRAAPSVLLSPMLLDIITAYQPGCCLDMRVFTSMDSPLKGVATILQPCLWWNDDTLVDVDPFASFDPVVTTWYAQVGHSRLTKLFACMPHMRDIVVAHAVYSGNLSVLVQLPVNVVRAVDIPLLDLAALKGNMDVLKYLHADVGHNGCTTWAADSAALHGHLNIVAYLLANRQEGYSWQAVHYAATNGHFDLVKFFHAHEPYTSVHFLLALRAAASHNHFAIASYIVDMFGPAERPSTQVMDGAACNGHLEMVQFLHEHSFDCSTNAMDWAAAGGHLDVVKWLHENRTEGCTTDAMDSAALEDHVDVVQWLHDHRQEGCTTNALFTAVGRERWAILPFLATHHDRGDVELALEFVLESTGSTPQVVAKLKSIIKGKQ